MHVPRSININPTSECSENQGCVWITLLSTDGINITQGDRLSTFREEEIYILARCQLQSTNVHKHCIQVGVLITRIMKLLCMYTKFEQVCTDIVDNDNKISQYCGCSK